MKPESRFTILRSVGRDELGEVSEAVDNVTGRQVALRTFDAAVTSSAGARQRLESALTALHKLGPARTPRPSALCLQQDGAWMAAEWVASPALTVFTGRMGALVPEIAAQIACGILDALVELHEAGAPHGSLTPNKVVLTQGFTTGGVVTTDPFLNLLAPKAAVPASYVAPEQAQGQDATIATDIYAVGLILFEMIAGAPAFGQGSAQDILQAQIQQPAPSLVQVKPEANVSPDLDAIVQLALSKDPSARFKTALAMRRALGSCRVIAFDEATEVASTPLGSARGQGVAELFIAAPAVDPAVAEAAARAAAQAAEAERVMAEALRQQEEAQQMIAAQQAEAARAMAEQLAEEQRQAEAKRQAEAAMAQAAAIAAQQAEAAAQQAESQRQAAAAQQAEAQRQAAAAQQAEAQRQADAAAQQAAAAAQQAEAQRQAAESQRQAAALQGETTRPSESFSTPVVPHEAVSAGVDYSGLPDEPKEKVAAWFAKAEDQDYLEARKLEATRPSNTDIKRSVNRRAVGVMVSVAAVILAAFVGVFLMGTGA